MSFKTILNKINPWIGLTVSLYFIIPSLYDILDSPLKITKNHFILAGSMLFMIIYLKEILDTNRKNNPYLQYWNKRKTQNQSL
jgi:hypothetical protein